MARGTDKRSDEPGAVRAAAPTGEGGELPTDGAAELGIDDILARLERVVKELEGGDLPLERALERFELGVRLARKGGTLLDRIEERVEMLMAERDEVVPLPREAREPNDDRG